ncbi:hypothetical protein A3Q56_04671 [Intoshia linei]|uniref:PHD-type domain-containing protein n=1 Tax=Intoshia linei TaxID=1819745 RepID=A0A177B001_9BILA|nr:hypothetical protein A3Q56_04671 [Intoshia linei]
MINQNLDEHLATTLVIKAAIPEVKIRDFANLKGIQKFFTQNIAIAFSYSKSLSLLLTNNMKAMIEFFQRFNYTNLYSNITLFDPLIIYMLALPWDFQKSYSRLWYLCKESKCKCGKLEYDFMIECDTCKDWFHGRCVKLKKTEADKMQNFVCKNCKKLEMKMYKKRPNKFKDFVVENQILMKIKSYDHNEKVVVEKTNLKIMVEK